jgi:four helix bundle protein
MSEIRSFEDLDAWKVCREVRIAISNLARMLPDEERYRLKDQMIRAARSTTANLAEGYGRYHFQENTQFCRHARASLYELRDHLLVARDEKLLDAKGIEEADALLRRAINVCNGYIRYLQNAKNRRRATEIKAAETGTEVR